MVTFFGPNVKTKKNLYTILILKFLAPCIVNVVGAAADLPG
jgi:hypothetical protein